MRELFIDGKRIADDERPWRVCIGCMASKAPSDYWGGRRLCKACTLLRNKRRYHEKYAPDPSFRATKNEKSRQYYASVKAERNAATRKRDKDMRVAALKHYGNACACCGESRYEFLGFDHINGGGNKHAALIKQPLARWLFKNGFPDGFRVLCHNCNFATGHYGYCPHSRESQCHVE